MAILSIRFAVCIDMRHLRRGVVILVHSMYFEKLLNGMESNTFTEEECETAENNPRVVKKGTV